MVNYNQLEELSARIAEQVIELVRTMTPDRTEKYTVQDFFSASNAVGGFVKSLGLKADKEVMRKRMNSAIGKACQAIYCLDMLNYMAVVDISCYEKTRSSYNELAILLSEALAELD